jgi:hypothetical protein
MNVFYMPWVEPSFEAPSHICISLSFFPSLAEVIICSDIFIHLLKLLQGLERFSGKVLGSQSWMKPLNHCFNDNLIWRLEPSVPEPEAE